MSVLEKFDLTGRTALVTGATRGLGRQFAISLSEAGADIIVHGRDQTAANDVANLVRENGRQAYVVIGDLVSEQGAQTVVSRAIDEGGRIDILVNNAGTSIHRDSLEVTASEWSHVMDTNLTSLWNVSQRVGRHMVERRSGAMINIGSISGIIVNRPQMQSAYNTSKAAVHQLTKSLAAEWAPQGIRVNALAPGYVKTEMSPVDDPKFRRHWIEDVPQQRYATPDELGPAVVFLASDASSFMTGSIVVVDGGYTLF